MRASTTVVAREVGFQMVRESTYFVGGKHVAGTSGQFGDVFDPSTGAVQARVPLATTEKVQVVIANAEEAQLAWGEWNPQRRARVLLKFLELVARDMDSLARTLASEHGKAIVDAKGDIQRGVEVIGFAAGAPHLLKGECSSGAGTGIDVCSMRQPLGVVAGITPFNFPAMIPLWKMGPALAAGNSFILKPSERDPSVLLCIAELFLEAGLPAGVLNVVNGDKVAVDALLMDDRVKAIGLIGSTPIAQYICETATANGKHAQCFGGSKNHMVVMPDADLDQVAGVVGTGHGSAGERCMAISVSVPVGKDTGDALAAKFAERAKSLKIGHSHDETADYGPLITMDAVGRVSDAIQIGVDERAELLADGRGHVVDGYENGFYLGPILFDHVAPEIHIYKEEVFGPVLIIVRADNYEDALRFSSEHMYGNGVSIFTRDGDTARDFCARVNTGMVGVNVPIPVPIAHHTFGGWKKSGFGDLNQLGPDSFRSYTKTKTVTSRWPSGIREGASFVTPAMH